MIRSLITQKIAVLCAEQAGMQAMVEAECYPPGSLGEARLQLGIALWQLKIELWLALLPGGRGNA